VKAAPDLAAASVLVFDAPSQVECPGYCTSPAKADSGRHTDSGVMGSVIKKRRKRMSKKKHRKLLRRTRVQRRKTRQVTSANGCRSSQVMPR